MIQQTCYIRVTYLSKYDAGLLLFGNLVHACAGNQVVNCPVVRPEDEQRIHQPVDTAYERDACENPMQYISEQHKARPARMRARDAVNYANF